MEKSHQEQSLSGDFLTGEGSFFRVHNVRVQEKISKEDWDAFCRLKTNEERIEFIYNLEVMHQTQLPQSPYHKTAEIGLKYKNVGNDYFSKAKYNLAAKFYSVGIIGCPNDEGELLSILYANRSAALYHLKEYHSALHDLSITFSLPYPDKNHHKAYERQAQCHLAINDIQKAHGNFKYALAALDKSGLDVKMRQKKEFDFFLMIKCLEKTLSSEGKPKIVHSTTKHPAVPELSREKNSKFPTASKLVKIVSEETAGRYAVADEDIEPGEVLVVESAHCATLTFEYFKSHCQNCFIRVMYPIPCPKCPNVVFCGLKCRNIALNSYHKYECGFLGCLHECGASITCYLALRLLTQKGLKYFIEIKDKLKKPLNMNKTYDTSDYRTVYNLCTHENRRTPTDLFQRSTMSTVLLQLLQKANFFANEPQSQLSADEKYIGSLILHNLFFLQFNAHEISELQYDSENPGAVECGKSQLIGGGLFPTVALFNHSCEPGIVRYFSGSKMVLRSVKPIKQGEMIAENYGPIYTEVDRNTRRDELAERYWFNCNCKPCVENWPLFDYMSDNILPIRCITPKCTEYFKVHTNRDEFMFQCPKCSTNNYIISSLKRIEETKSLLTKSTRLTQDLNYGDALKVFLQTIKIMDSVLRPPYKDFCLLQQRIRDCMLTLGNAYQKI